MGVILYILLCGFPPFRSRDRDQEELFQLIKQGDLHFLSPYWDAISDGEAKAHIHTHMHMHIHTRTYARTHAASDGANSKISILQCRNTIFLQVKVRNSKFT